jgi:hypothetical protein
VSNNWNPWRQTIDYAVISGKQTPGILRLRNADSPRAWDERNGYGWSGSFPVFMGVRLSHFDMGFEMYDEDDLALWRELEPLLAKPPFGKRPQALSIQHPLLAPLEISSIQVLNVKQWEFDEYGVITQPVEVIAFRSPKFSLSKPQGAKQKDDDDPYDKQINALAARNQKDFDELSQALAKSK